MKGILQHADDPGGALVLGALQFEPLDHRVVGRGADERHRARWGTSASSAPSESAMLHVELVGDARRQLLG